MSFANPSWLWGLSALIVPLTIHLLSRKEGKVIKMGSLRYLKDSNTQQFKSLRLNEIVLFILRCLLIVLVVLFLSGLQWSSTNNRKWVIREDALKNNTTAQSLTDSLIKKGYELHSLSDDLALDDQTSSNSYWALTEQLTQRAIDEVVIISTTRAEAFKGDRIKSKTSVKWITVPSTTKSSYPVTAIRKGIDTVTVIQGSLENENTQYKQVTIHTSRDQKLVTAGNDSIAIIPNDTVMVTIVSDPNFGYDKKMIIALLNVLKKNTFNHLVIDESSATAWDENSSHSDWLIWLSEKPLPASVTASTISYQLDQNTPLLYQQSISHWVLSKRLNQEVILNESLSTQLAQVIFTDQAIWKLADKKDQRTMPEEMMWSSLSAYEAGAIKSGFTTLDHYLVILFVLVWITERIIAYKRNQ